MTVVIKKKTSLRQITSAKQRLTKKKESKTGLAAYFGALKRGLDGLQYQKDVRNEWH